ncbi:MAG: RNA binding S1 domain protein [Candidatus Nomurabacteria bacterium GW2011_GWE1_32_28]|uniref:RNA binding S1 domain protein n=1 Tax=Candidatus Nomurabacteria bacterium GW2011_GWF1_31_48 TaxID=1618767 RepID=A0A0F9YW11_9BACT|nr:MAG: RNA binding S1 domain protein [Candidatus Nomurabacteria bacterium GW2011_GWF2_30_133]KKP28888.1 MAG: RNA binding S1 domain protein [Candidatus Nomurabacteria bacterium GW2011_GWE2_31_40]KKP30626.1 MAG: RNA binding S1 domain protein [Candidatus Nomurabacteria bacterium GW2011_GWF1_31_48]KKP35144.1 MAG: RNA binding S1 domain protein [Candidatus Nomurabacteria bacterium GW2011_GWE1_32_28]HAS80454.1 30S ribosomal protein S1 [Candidatus Nomurabacteria bacterium]
MSALLRMFLFKLIIIMNKEKEEVIQENLVLKSIVDRSLSRPEADSLIEGKVILVEKSSVFVDLSPFGTGIIYGREFINAKDIIKKIRIGDTIKTKVVEKENENGYTELSLKEAKQALTWNDAEKAIKAKTILELEIKDANKGGLILEWQGIQGFLPASQLKSEHYPHVLDSDKDKILKELKKLVGEKISVMIISTLPKEGKLIFSEKDNNPEEKKEILSKYNIGDELECTVAGLVDFGVFLKLEDGLEGLVHISELDWGLVEDPRTIFKVGDTVKAKVIEKKDGKISLSIKALKENPWTEFEEKLKKGDIIKGVVIKYNKHGALVSIKEGVAGLVHNSTFGTETKLREKLELGKNYNFQITLFEPKEHKMTLIHLE